MKDDAVAPVIAAMLVLAIIVTVFSVWTTVALPSMKAEAEISHLKDVERSFARFSSDLSNAASQKQEVTFSETVQLGGGSVLFSPASSSGTLRVDPEAVPVYEIVVFNDTSAHAEEGRLVRFSYRPLGNYWQDQGYSWHYGFVNVTKGYNPLGPDSAGMASPLAFAGMAHLNRSQPLRQFAGSLIGISAGSWYNSTGNCSEIAISAATISPSTKDRFASGNGIGTLAVSATVNETVFGIPGSSSPGRLVIRVNRSVPAWFADSLYDRCNQSLHSLNRTYPQNVWHSADNSSPLYRETSAGPVDGRLPFSVSRRIVQLNVTVQ